MSTDVTTAVQLADNVPLALAGVRRVAVVGLSDDRHRTSNSVARAMVDAGYEVVPVNPTIDEALGLQAYPDLASVPGRIDMVNVFRRREHLAGVAREAVARDDVAAVFNQQALVSEEARAIVTGAGRAYVEDACMAVEVRRGARPPAAPRLDCDVVLLDLDDTILDHAECERGAVAATLRAFGLPSDSLVIDIYARVNAAAWAAYRAGHIDPPTLRLARWQKTLAEAGFDADPAPIAEHYLDAFAATGVILPGAPQALWWLARRARLAIVTNGFADVQRRRLAATGLDGLIEVFVSSEEAGAAKPDPAMFALALERLGVGDLDPSRVLVVGDQQDADVAAGAAFGATTVWVAPDHLEPDPDGPQADHRVNRLADLA